MDGKVSLKAPFIWRWSRRMYVVLASERVQTMRERPELPRGGLSGRGHALVKRGQGVEGERVSQAIA
ncbi:uncharacterized [Tachysurus ichikawai]